MLEKLKLFNSKSSSKSSPETVVPVKTSEKAEIGLNTDLFEADEGNVRPGMNGATPVTASSPKMALKGIAQRTFSRALTAKKSSVKAPEKDKEKGKAKETTNRVSGGSSDLKVDEAKEEALNVDLDSASNKRASKIASFIPKGGKVAKKDAHSGIPKPGAKTQNGKTKEVTERPRSMRLGAGLALTKGPLDRDSKHSSSTSSLASTEGQKTSANIAYSAPSLAGGGMTQSTASNTVSVQLPQNQQHHSHPNMATVAPFMYR